ncbi:MAG: class I SAM-dependent methyltransferase [candidate division KSB1 bacterium]|nr:class I SAM-dependent methyltransferase [candidate division KSB1 bacterium]
MRHVNYARWARYVISLFELAEDGPVQNVLELACGTGKMMAELSQAGYSVYGLDSSYEMVKIAAERLSRLQVANCRLEEASCPLPPAPCSVWCGDMQNFAVASPVDAAICLYDSFNYCMEPEGARRTLNCVASAVRCGGLFIFDVCTERNCRKHFNNYYERDSYQHFSYIRQSYFKPFRKIQINEFFIINEMNGGPAMYERHEQRIYSLREINEMIDARQWSVAGCFDGMSRRSGTEGSDRVHFVLQRR